jgi:adenosylcobinamide-GDP ribazoletransferase
VKSYTETAHDLIIDLRIAISLCTRLPIGPPATIGDGEVARASWALPVAGLVVGLFGAATYWIAARSHVPPLPASALAIAATVLLTGAMHEDGLADTADGFGGGKTQESKLEIMRDSRIGTFGSCALILSLMLRWSALAEIAEPRLVAVALIAAHVSARAVLPIVMSFVPPARADGLSSGAGQPPQQSAAIALALGTICLLFSFGPSGALVALLALGAIGLLLTRLAIKAIGGQTGDVLGALEQVGEVAVLLIAASLL